ncbi:N-acetylmuramoyl-L-alanine amidase [Candidatus Sumerlaeota bacterium]|nr:N-acetylmuramoyl-L-alanine amidase [Candidatus Sumerlaeota bacterium]
MRTPTLTLLLTALVASLGAQGVNPLSGPEHFDAQWLAVRPRTPEGPYPNLPADWEPMPNPRCEVPEGRPLEGLRICVDPGHGGQIWGPTHGYTGGTRGRETGLTESDMNLRTALFLWDLLTQAGAEVVMTRTRPERVTPAGSGAREELHGRVAIAEEAGCDHFVSIHHNAIGGGQSIDTNTTAVYYFDTSHCDDAYNADAPYAQRHPDALLNQERIDLALSIQEALVRHLGLPTAPPAAGSPGVPHGDFHVLRETHLPAVLVEASFMTNPEEDLRLNDPARAKQEATAIFEGILAHFETHPMRPWRENAPSAAMRE